MPHPSFKVFVPAYNEEDSIKPLVLEFDLLAKALRARKLRLLVFFVDDGSKDLTVKRVREAKKGRGYLNLIRHPQNRGLAGVLETILEQAGQGGGKNCFGVGVLDGDGSHPPLLFEAMIAKLREDADVVIASRFQPGSSISGVALHRRLYSLASSLLFRLLGRLKNVRDYSCGFRAYRMETIADLRGYRFRNRSFACMTELLFCCGRLGAVFAEVPFHLAYDRKKGPSKMPVVRTILESLTIPFNSPAVSSISRKG